QVQSAAAAHNIWTIVGTIQPTANKFLNLMHVINPQGRITHEYAKVNMAGRDETQYCRGGDKLSLFEIDGVLCTMVICRDGR
ncbi:nitrilase-related carbon-nitrogen hydrolase, partial [Streptomyces caeruleatus]